MKVLIVCKAQDTLLYNSAEKASAYLEQQGIESEIIYVPEQVQGCTGCGRCWKKKLCVFEDEVNTAAEKLRECDGFMVLSPVFYGEPDRMMLNFLDRLTHCASEAMAFRPAVSMFSSRASSALRAQTKINEYFMYADMVIVSHKGGFRLKEENDILIPAARLAWVMNSLDENRDRPEMEYIRELDYVR